ncbi:MAG: hypothetical protein U0Q07_19075 [Acidimicrobiales bacterium]
MDPSDQPVPPTAAWSWAAPDSPSGTGATGGSAGGGPVGSSGGLADVVLDPDAIDGVPVDDGDDDVGPRPSGPPRLPVPLRPLTVSDILDGAFAIIKARPRTVVLIAACIVVPAHMLSAYLARGSTSVSDILSAVVEPGAVSARSQAGLLGVYLGAAVQALSYFFLGGALGRLVSAWYAGGDLTAGAALKASLRRTPAFLAAFAMLLPLKVAAYAACILPVLAVIALFSLTAPVIVIEGLGPFAAAKRSATLVGRRFFPSVWVITLATLVAQIITPMLAIIPEVFAALAPEGVRWVILGAGQAAVSLLMAPFAVGVCILLYLDLRVRTEGLDIELDAAAAFVEPR